ncbi:MAG: PD-(D/E)XK nuclease family protein [Fibrobacteria bacterium]|nr:PD-(D/E)XK nuclease family protein [Fibrobacteria bacterium]
MKTINVSSLSYSTVKQFTEGCTEQVFLDKVDRCPKIGTSAAALMGSAFHSVSESYYRALLLGHQLDAEVLFRVFEARWNLANQDEIIYGAKHTQESIFEQAKQLIELLLEAEQPKEILAIEKPVQFQLTDDLKIIGKADLIYRDKDGRLTISDVKTSASAYSDTDLYNVAEQTYTYSLFFSEPVKQKLQLFIKTKTPRYEEIELNSDDINFSDWKEKFIQTKHGLENGIRYKVHSWQCKTCGFSYICQQKCNETLNRKAA